ncbi:AAA family ATPase [Acinetobacter thermotolerans]|uniref:AAA family ATPase n=1 Tax=Acinetobacter thermotolerans TaxID=3151487 RepID=UPI00325A4ECB
MSDDIDFEVNHLYMQNIKMDNIEDLILSNFRRAKYKAAQRIQNALFDTLSEVIDIESGSSKLNKDNLFNFDDSFFEILTEKKNQIIESISISEHNSFKNGVLNILQNIENKEYQDKIKENKLLRQMFKNIIDELNNEELHLSSINYLVDTFNFFLSDDKKFEINVNEIIVKIGDIAHSIHDLSSGERHMLTFLSLVLFVGSGRNFLIIDEPEISLNMKWQRQLIELFKIMLPNVQIIVASHSPFLAKNQPNMLCKFENKVV